MDYNEDKLDESENPISMITAQSLVVNSFTSHSPNEDKLDASGIAPTNPTQPSGFEIIGEDYVSKKEKNDSVNPLSAVIAQSKSELKESQYENVNLDTNPYTAANTGYLEVEDNGNTMSYLGNVRKYEISEVKEEKKNEISEVKEEKKKILCYRRFSNFVSFYSALQISYPHYIFPKLSEKNFFTKFTNDALFLERRRKQIKFFVNFLYKHPVLSRSKEFLKFIKDAEFDENFFKNRPPLFSYPELDNLTTGSLMSKLTSLNPFARGQSSNTHKSRSQSELRRNETKYKEISEKVNSIFIELNNVEISLGEEEKSLNEIDRSILFLKSKKNFSNENGVNEEKDYANVYQMSNNICNCYSEINKKRSIAKIVDEFDEFNLVLSGICEGFDRYNEFVKNFERVHLTVEQAKANNFSGVDRKIVEKVVERANEDKEKFENKLIEEIVCFSTNNANKFEELLKKFFDLMKEINCMERNELEECQKSFN